MNHVCVSLGNRCRLNFLQYDFLGTTHFQLLQVAAAPLKLQSFPGAQLDLVSLLRKSLLGEQVGLMTCRTHLGASYSFVQGWLSLASVGELTALK